MKKKKRKRTSKVARIRWHVEQTCYHRHLAVILGVAAVDKYKEALEKESLWAALVSLSVAYADAGRCLSNIRTVRYHTEEVCTMAGTRLVGDSHVSKVRRGLFGLSNWLTVLRTAMDDKDVSQIDYMRNIIDLEERLDIVVSRARGTEHAVRRACAMYGIDFD